MRKENRVFYFSVEGETEKWYFDWLKDTINAVSSSKYTVKLDCRVQKDPLSRAKGLTTLGPVEITHVVDRESEDEVHQRQFITTLDRMKKAQKLGKNIKFALGYSNYTFELWIILHKSDCNSIFSHRSQYLTPLNKAYEEEFENLDQYKHEDNFKRILAKLTLDDVRSAIQRSKNIMQNNQKSGYVLQEYKGYIYYKQNPSLSIWETVEKILKECELLI